MNSKIGELKTLVKAEAAEEITSQFGKSLSKLLKTRHEGKNLVAVKEKQINKPTIMFIRMSADLPSETMEAKKLKVRQAGPDHPHLAGNSHAPPHSFIIGWELPGPALSWGRVGFKGT
jgi:hypothetical protein